jgi:chromosome segregation ATPase
MVKDLAPFSTKYTFVKGKKSRVPHMGATRFDGHNSSCM